MKIISLFLVPVFLFAGINLFAQDQPFNLTLDQAVEYALQHNKTILNARDQVKSSTYKIRETRAQGLPQISGTVDYMTYFNYEMNFSFGSSGETPVIPDFTQPPFDQGDALTYGAIMQMLGSMGSSEPIVMTDQMNGAVQVSMLLFSGQYWAGLKAAQIGAELTKQNLTRTEQDIRESVTNSYYLILTSEQNLRIIDENIKNLTSIMEHTNNMYKSGVAEQTDVDQLKISVSQLENARNMYERAMKMSYNLLRFQMGVAPDAHITLSENIDGVLTKVTPVGALNTGFDITDNINYGLMESQVKLGEKQVDIQTWAFAPTVSGFYSYTEKFMVTGFDMTPNNLAGVTVNIPIFSSGMRRAKVSQAKIDLNIAERNREFTKEQLEMQKNQLLFEYQNAYENYLMQKENVNVARRVFQNFQNKYEQGMVSSLDLTQSNSNLLNAQSNYLSSVLTLLQAQTSLDKLFNKI